MVPLYNKVTTVRDNLLKKHGLTRTTLGNRHHIVKVSQEWADNFTVEEAL